MDSLPAQFQRFGKLRCQSTHGIVVNGLGHPSGADGCSNGYALNLCFVEGLMIQVYSFQNNYHVAECFHALAFPSPPILVDGSHFF